MPGRLKTFASLTLLATTLVSPSFGKEMPTSLREANRLYQAGQFSAAISLAKKSVVYAPEDVQAMLILGMSYFNEKNYPEARDWFRKAVQRKPKHPIARKYIGLIQEIEHRYGPFSSSLSTAQESKDPTISGEAFKKGWFGHSFPKESEKAKDYFEPEKHKPARIALEVDAPLEKILIEKSVASMAKEAFDSKLFLKSYLFYSQLLAANPNNRSYLVGKAGAAFHMKRYQEVIKTLGPMMLAADDKSFSKLELKQARGLMQAARKKLYD